MTTEPSWQPLRPSSAAPRPGSTPGASGPDPTGAGTSGPDTPGPKTSGLDLPGAAPDRPVRAPVTPGSDAPTEVGQRPTRPGDVAGKPPQVPPRQAGPAQAPPAAAPEPRFTRAAAAWFATAAALLLLILLIIFILQNQARVAVRFFGLEGILPLGTAMLIAAVTGGMVVVIIGVVRMVQLRRSARRVRGRQ